MRIATFGSCMSWNIGLTYRKLFGGKVVSAVYHNRSDHFLACHIDKRITLPPFKEMLPLLLSEAEEQKEPEERATQILRNQYPDGIGLHRLGKLGILFPTAVKARKIDLLLLDNYIDLAGRMIRCIDGPLAGTQVFLRASDFLPTSGKWELGPSLGVDESLANMGRIVAWVREHSPDTHIAFCCFPHNTYEGKPEWVERASSFSSRLDLPGTLTIPALDVPKSMQTKHKQHFEVAFYAALAGIVHQRFEGY